MGRSSRSVLLVRNAASVWLSWRYHFQSLRGSRRDNWCAGDRRPVRAALRALRDLEPDREASLVVLYAHLDDPFGCGTAAEAAAYSAFGAHRCGGTPLQHGIPLRELRGQALPLQVQQRLLLLLPGNATTEHKTLFAAAGMSVSSHRRAGLVHPLPGSSRDRSNRPPRRTKPLPEGPR